MLQRLAALAVVAVLPAAAPAEVKKPAKPSGTYTREAGERKVSWTFKEDTLTIRIQIGEGRLDYEAAYGITKDGLLFGVMTKAEKKDIDGGPGKEDLISFRYTLGEGELKISDLKGTSIGDEAKRLVEGTYKKEK